MDVCPKECIKYYIRGTDIEVKHLFIPIIIICAIVVAVIFVSVLWRPLIDILSYFI
jgi:t-SNARE complex subunit (syntaxin)